MNILTIVFISKKHMREHVWRKCHRHLRYGRFRPL